MMVASLAWESSDSKQYSASWDYLIISEFFDYLVEHFKL